MPSVLLEINQAVAVITLNRPASFNAFNREMSLLLQQHLDTCNENKAVRCILLTGNGKAFCAGQDLAELTGEHPMPIEKILSEHFNPIVTRLRNIPKPIVCAVNGVAAGAGANIALACDVVTATASASFIQAFSKIGLIPDSGGTYTLPRLIGFQKASALMMLGERVIAADAEKMGMIYKCISDETFQEESKKIAETLSQMPTKGLALTKQALNESLNNSFDQQLLVEDKLQFIAAQTIDYNEGVTAFLEKRKPVFKGE